MSDTNTMFYRVDKNGDAQIFNNDGSVATRIDENVYPIGSKLGAKYEHVNGIILSVEDAEKIEIMAE